MTPFRSLLFTPAARPDRFAKALAAGADAVCLDPEDATPPDAKAAAREAAGELLRGPRAGAPRLGVRINAAGTPWRTEDLALAPLADFVMTPKATDPASFADLRERAPGVDVWPLVETAEGLRRVWEIAEVEGVAGVLFGAFDYAADLGCELAWEPLLTARALIAAACAANGRLAMDAPCGELAKTDGLEASTRRARGLGFAARACIHPAQVPVVNRVFTPTADEVAAARRVVAAFEARGGGAAQLDGRLLEAPVARAARRLLAQGGN